MEQGTATASAASAAAASAARGAMVPALVSEKRRSRMELQRQAEEVRARLEKQRGTLGGERGGGVGPWHFHGCYWEAFDIFAYCGLVGNPHLAARIYFFAPLPASTKFWWVGGAWRGPNDI